MMNENLNGKVPSLTEGSTLFNVIYEDKLKLASKVNSNQKSFISHSFTENLDLIFGFIEVSKIMVFAHHVTHRIELNSKLNLMKNS